MDNCQSLQKRNEYIDILRGIAMLLVVLGHTMTGCTTNSEQSVLFNIIWSLQMPLFILISGYVTRYSKGIKTALDLWKYVKKRTVAYIFPWIIWTFCVRGLMFNKTDGLFDVGHIFWNMDSGYWFLITIWTINIIFGISQLLSSCICKSEHRVKKNAALLFFYIIGMGILGALGSILGMSFFTIKLTLYYMPFYFAGYLYGQTRDAVYSKRSGKIIIDIIVAICTVIWLTAIFRLNLYSLPDSGLPILIRAAVSLAGCISVCGLCKGLFVNEEKKQLGGIQKALEWAGAHSMEIYMTHYLLLCLIQLEIKPVAMSVSGIGIIVANYIVTIATVTLSIRLLSSSKVIRTLLYGRIK